MARPLTFSPLLPLACSPLLPFFRSLRPWAPPWPLGPLVGRPQGCFSRPQAVLHAAPRAAAPTPRTADPKIPQKSRNFPVSMGNYEKWVSPPKPPLMKKKKNKKRRTPLYFCLLFRSLFEKKDKKRGEQKKKNPLFFFLPACVFHLCSSGELKARRCTGSPPARSGSGGAAGRCKRAREERERGRPREREKERGTGEAATRRTSEGRKERNRGT